MNGARMIFTTAMLCAASLLPSVALAGDRGNRADAGSDASFRITSPIAADGYTAMKTSGGVTIFVSKTELFSGQDVAGFRTISGNGNESLELSLPSNASDRLTSTVRSTKSSQLAIVRGKKLLAVVHVDLESGSQPRLAGLPVGGANRVTRLIKKAPAVVSDAIVTVVPRQARVKPGEQFTVDVFVSGVSGVSTYQFKMGVSGGTSGKLTRVSGEIDRTRGDYLFGTKQVVAAVDEMNGRFGGTTMQGVVDAQSPKYTGSYTFRASPDAAGEFSVSVTRGSDTFVSIPTVSRIPYRATGAVISVSR